MTLVHWKGKLLQFDLQQLFSCALGGARFKWVKVLNMLSSLSRMQRIRLQKWLWAFCQSEKTVTYTSRRQWPSRISIWTNGASSPDGKGKALRAFRYIIKTIIVSKTGKILLTETILVPQMNVFQPRDDILKSARLRNFLNVILLNLLAETSRSVWKLILMCGGIKW